MRQLSERLKVPACTLIRWASEYEKDGEDSFPDRGKPPVNKDYEILKLKKEYEELKECSFVQYFSKKGVPPTKLQW